MSEGVQIDQIDQLKPGDVLVLGVPEEFKHLLGDYCLTNGKAYTIYEAANGNAWIDCDCCVGGLGFELHGLEAAGLLRFFRVKASGEAPPLMFVSVGTLSFTNVRPGSFIPATPVLSDTDWDGTDGLGDEPPTRRVRYARLGAFDLAVLPSGMLLYKRPDGSWLEVKTSGRPEPDIPCGAQAMSDETPILTERAICPEQPIGFERAKYQETPFAPERAECLETPFALERAILNEKPTLLDRAMQFEPTITGERDLPQEQTKLLDRAMLPEQPKQHEPLDFLALNKEFSSK